MERVLRAHNYLRVYNYANITDRLQRATNGNMFVAYNGFNGRFEVHAITSFIMDKGNSLQVSFENTAFLNEWLIRDIKANDHRKYFQEIKGTREYLEKLYENHENKVSDRYTEDALRHLETILGRRI
jgi:hypothetical protein